MYPLWPPVPSNSLTLPTPCTIAPHTNPTPPSPPPVAVFMASVVPSAPPPPSAQDGGLCNIISIASLNCNGQLCNNAFDHIAQCMASAAAAHDIWAFVDTRLSTRRHHRCLQRAVSRFVGGNTSTTSSLNLLQGLPNAAPMCIAGGVSIVVRNAWHVVHSISDPKEWGRFAVVVCRPRSKPSAPLLAVVAVYAAVPANADRGGNAFWVRQRGQLDDDDDRSPTAVLKDDLCAVLHDLRCNMQVAHTLIVGDFNDDPVEAAVHHTGLVRSLLRAGRVQLPGNLTRTHISRPLPPVYWQQGHRNGYLIGAPLLALPSNGAHLRLDVIHKRVSGTDHLIVSGAVHLPSNWTHLVPTPWRVKIVRPQLKSMHQKQHVWAVSEGLAKDMSPADTASISTGLHKLATSATATPDPLAPRGYYRCAPPPHILWKSQRRLPLFLRSLAVTLHLAASRVHGLSRRGVVDGSSVRRWAWRLRADLRLALREGELHPHCRHWSGGTVISSIMCALNRWCDRPNALSVQKRPLREWCSASASRLDNAAALTNKRLQTASLSHHQEARALAQADTASGAHLRQDIHAALSRLRAAQGKGHSGGLQDQVPVVQEHGEVVLGSHACANARARHVQSLHSPVKDSWMERVHTQEQVALALGLASGDLTRRDRALSRICHICSQSGLFGAGVAMHNVLFSWIKLLQVGRSQTSAWRRLSPTQFSEQLLSPMSRHDLLTLLNKRDSAPGISGSSWALLRHAHPDFQDKLVQCLNMVMAKSRSHPWSPLPDFLRISVTVLLRKPGGSSDLKRLRPIVLQEVLRKVLGGLILQRLQTAGHSAELDGLHFDPLRSVRPVQHSPSSSLNHAFHSGRNAHSATASFQAAIASAQAHCLPVAAFEWDVSNAYGSASPFSLALGLALLGAPADAIAVLVTYCIGGVTCVRPESVAFDLPTSVDHPPPLDANKVTLQSGLLQGAAESPALWVWCFQPALAYMGALTREREARLLPYPALRSLLDPAQPASFVAFADDSAGLSYNVEDAVEVNWSLSCALMLLGLPANVEKTVVRTSYYWWRRFGWHNIPFFSAGGFKSLGFITVDTRPVSPMTLLGSAVTLRPIPTAPAPFTAARLKLEHFMEELQLNPRLHFNVCMRVIATVVIPATGWALTGSSLSLPWVEELDRLLLKHIKKLYKSALPVSISWAASAAAWSCVPSLYRWVVQNRCMWFASSCGPATVDSFVQHLSVAVADYYGDDCEVLSTSRRRDPFGGAGVAHRDWTARGRVELNPAAQAAASLASAGVAFARPGQPLSPHAAAAVAMVARPLLEDVACPSNPYSYRSPAERTARHTASVVTALAEMVGLICPPSPQPGHHTPSLCFSRNLRISRALPTCVLEAAGRLSIPRQHGLSDVLDSLQRWHDLHHRRPLAELAMWCDASSHCTTDDSFNRAFTGVGAVVIRVTNEAGNRGMAVVRVSGIGENDRSGTSYRAEAAAALAATVLTCLVNTHGPPAPLPVRLPSSAGSIKFFTDACSVIMHIGSITRAFSPYRVLRSKSVASDLTSAIAVLSRPPAASRCQDPPQLDLHALALDRDGISPPLGQVPPQMHVPTSRCPRAWCYVRAHAELMVCVPTLLGEATTGNLLADFFTRNEAFVINNGEECIRVVTPTQDALDRLAEVGVAAGSPEHRAMVDPMVHESVTQLWARTQLAGMDCDLFHQTVVSVDLEEVLRLAVGIAPVLSAVHPLVQLDVASVEPQLRRVPRDLFPQCHEDGSPAAADQWASLALQQRSCSAGVYGLRPVLSRGLSQYILDRAAVQRLAYARAHQDRLVRWKVHMRSVAPRRNGTGGVTVGDLCVPSLQLDWSDLDISLIGAVLQTRNVHQPAHPMSPDFPRARGVASAWMSLVRMTEWTLMRLNRLDFFSAGVGAQRRTGRAGLCCPHCPDRHLHSAFHLLFMCQVPCLVHLRNQALAALTELLQPSAPPPSVLHAIMSMRRHNCSVNISLQENINFALRLLHGCVLRSDTRGMMNFLSKRLPGASPAERRGTRLMALRICVWLGSITRHVDRQLCKGSPFFPSSSAPPSHRLGYVRCSSVFQSVDQTLRLSARRAVLRDRFDQVELGLTHLADAQTAAAVHPVLVEAAAPLPRLIPSVPTDVDAAEADPVQLAGIVLAPPTPSLPQVHCLSGLNTVLPASVYVTVGTRHSHTIRSQRYRDACRCIPLDDGVINEWRSNQLFFVSVPPDNFGSIVDRPSE